MKALKDLLKQIKMKINKEIIAQLDREFEIESRFIWEGVASVYFEEVDIRKNDVLLKLKVSGHSMVEHESDERGINDNVFELNHKRKRLVLDGQLCEVVIHEAKVETTSDGRFDDGDYGVTSKGHVILTLKEINE